MKLNEDIKSAWLIHAKGALFAVLALIALAFVWIQIPSFQNAILLCLAIWAACRFYYYLFYVLERYLGRDQKFAGVFDALSYLLTKRRKDGKK